MADRAIRIKVGASVDGNPADVFTPYIVAAKRAQSQVSDALNKVGRAGKAIGPAVKAGASEADKAMIALERSAAGLEPKVDRGTKAIQAFGTSAQKSFAAARLEFDRLAREAERNANKIEKALEPKKRAPRVTRRGLETGLSYVGRIGMGALNPAARFGGDLVRGLGVNTDLSSMFAANAGIESKATQLSNAAFMPGTAGANGVRQDPQAIIAQARSVANETAMSTNDAIEGLQEFVGKTGDLETGRNILKDMAVLSKATGTSMSDMVSAAGDVANQLGDIPQKGDVINRIMRTVAGQGKLGAVEIRDMASQMAKIAAVSRQFSGGVEGNIGLLGAMAQEARQAGGAASANQAATSVMSFVAQFSKGARTGAMASFGVQARDASGKIRSVDQLLPEMFNAAMKHGGPTRFVGNMQGMIADQQAQRASRGFQSLFLDTYNKSTGTETERLAEATKAVRAEFERLINVQMANEEIQESFRRQMQTSESKTQLFNNRMQEVAAELQTALLPALIALTPAILELARGTSLAIQGLTGTGGLDKGRAEFEAGSSATNAELHASAALRGAYGVENGAKGDVALIPEGMRENLSEQRASVAKALAEKEEEAAKARAAASPDFTTALTAGGVSAAFMTTEERKEKSGVVESERRLLAQHLQDLVTAQTRLEDALLSGRAKMQVTNLKQQTPPARTPSPAPVPFEASTAP